MIELIKRGDGNFCGCDQSYGEARFEGKTVDEVLDEIREYSHKKNACYIGDGFGNEGAPDFCACWAVYVNDEVVASNWLNHTPNYKGDKGGWIVDRVTYDGGQYCWYDFRIHATEPREAVEARQREEWKEFEEKLKRLLEI